MTPGAMLADMSGTRSGGPQKMHLCAHRRQQVSVRSRHPAVEDVADDDYAQALEALLVLGNGQRIKQPLRRMLVQSIAGIDHRHRTVSATADMARRCWDDA